MSILGMQWANQRLQTKTRLELEVRGTDIAALQNWKKEVEELVVDRIYRSEVMELLELNEELDRPLSLEKAD